jgi:hypothetical protein
VRAHQKPRRLHRKGAHQRRGERRLFAVVAIVAALLTGLGGTVFAYLSLSATGPSSAKAETLAAPNDLSATATSGKVTLSWSDTTPWTTSATTPPVKYLLYRCTGTGCSASSTIATGACATTSYTNALSTTSCTDTSVTPDTTYGYAVVAVYDKWVSPPSSTKYITTPSKPTIASSVVAYNNNESDSTSIQTDKPGSDRSGGEVTVAPSTDYLVFAGETRCTSRVTAPKLSFQTTSPSFATVAFVSTTTPTLEYFTAAHAVEEWVYTVKAGPGASGYAKVKATFTTSSASQCCGQDQSQQCCGQDQGQQCCGQGQNQQCCGQDQQCCGQNQNEQCCGQGQNQGQPDDGGQQCCGQGQNQSQDCCGQGQNQQCCGQDQSQNQQCCGQGQNPQCGQNQNDQDQNQGQPEDGDQQCCGQDQNAAEPDDGGEQCCTQHRSTRSYLWVVKLTNVTLSKPVLTTGNYTGTSTEKGSTSLSVTMASTPPSSDAAMVFLYATGKDATTPTSSTGMSTVDTPTGTPTWTAHDTGSAGLWFKSSATKQETFTDLTPSTTWFALSLVLNDPPTVTDLSPDHGSTAGGTSVTITGTGFTKTAVVVFGTVPATDVTVNSSTSITAVSPGHPAPGVVAVSVSTERGTSLTSAGDQYTYTTSTAASVSSLSPATGPAAGGTQVTLTGTGFTQTATVDFGSTPAASVTVSSTTSITAVTPPHVPGPVTVSVTTANGIASAEFTYTTGTTPSVTALSPATGPVTGGTPVTITGTDFTNTATVSFGSTAAASVTVNSATSITAVTPPHAAGSVTVSVTTPKGTASAGQQFTYTTGTTTPAGTTGSQSTTPHAGTTPKSTPPATTPPATTPPAATPPATTPPATTPPAGTTGATTPKSTPPTTTPPAGTTGTTTPASTPASTATGGSSGTGGTG